METARQIKKLKTPKEALQPIKSGQTVMVGGFGLSGTPITLLYHLLEMPVKDLTIISNNLGESNRGLGKLLLNRQIKKAIGSFFTSNRDAIAMWERGEVELELLPQGTLAEAIRAGGAGIGGFYTPTAVGTELAKGKEERVIDGKRYIFEKALKADVALIKAYKADELGNLIYWKTADNFNSMMATAADYVVAQVDEIVPVGALSPEEIKTPHLYVDALVLNEHLPVE